MEDLKNSQKRDSRSRDSVDKAKALALKLLGYRLRSEAEIRERLLRKGYSIETLNRVIEDLKAFGLINDLEAARSFVRTAESKLHGPRRIRELLLKRGIPADIVEEVVSQRDDMGKATELLKKWLKARSINTPEEMRRFRQYMLRRGYNHETINELLKRSLGPQKIGECLGDPSMEEL